MKKWVSLSLFVIAVFAIGGSADAATTYSLSPPAPLLDADYYAGIDKNGAGPAPGRFAMFAQSSKAANHVAFWMVSNDFAEVALFAVTVGQPGSWRRITGHLNAIPNAPISWTPDDQYIIVGPYRFDAVTGASTAPVFVDGAPYGINNTGLNDASTTSKASGNWLVTLNRTAGQSQIVAVPILPNGDLDPAREAAMVTNFSSSVQPDWPAISHDGSMVAFANFLAGGNSGTSTPDAGDNYAIVNLPAIIAAPKIPGTFISSLAPTSTADPNVIAIRTNETVDNFAHVPIFSQDNSLVLFTEDWNNIFTDSDFFGTLAIADFDVMLSNSDGSGVDIRFAEPGNQFISSVTPGGIRVVYLTGAGTDMELYMTSLETETDVAGDDVSNTTIQVDTGEGMENVQLGDNALQIPVSAPDPVVVGDASGTAVVLPPGQVIDFPPGTPQAISVTTPVNPVEPVQLPANAPVDAIPVVREFGPTGTNFYPPIVITITYTDAEVAGLVESSITPYLFNTLTGAFDIRVNESDIVERNAAENYIKFRVSHFSTYGLGAKTDNSDLPLSLWAVVAVAIALAGVSAFTMKRLRRV